MDYKTCHNNLAIACLVVTLVNHLEIMHCLQDSNENVNSSGLTRNFCREENAISCEDGLGNCFSEKSKCDGVTDCPNGFDESVRNCGCLSGEFQCSDECIEQILLCNTEKDCLDGSDEKNCESYVCPPNHIKCDNHFCVPTDKLCNFVDDCGDNSDEHSCTFRRCWFQEFKCDNGQCVQNHEICDGVEDCVDGSDEKSCNEEDFRDCGHEKRAHKSVWCDGFADCPTNHADEIGCGNCSEKEFKCANGRCIALSHLCDTRCDCAGSCEDEAHCEKYYQLINGLKICNRKTTLTCSKDGPCILPSIMCNNISDCPFHEDFESAGLDEYGCGISEEECKVFDYGFWCPEGRCISRSMRCNFFPECLNGEDEKDCEFPKCDQYQCHNGQCVHLNRVCDSKIDCYDKSDELYCEKVSCPKGWRKCSSGQCIQEAVWCDHIPDCFDGSDEELCDYRILQRAADPEREFTCLNGQIINIEFRCLMTANKRQGCADGSHLLGCDNWNCPENSTKCINSYCVHQNLVCDGKMDCARSWTDEEKCTFNCSASKCPCIDILINCTGLGINSIPTKIESSISRIMMRGNDLGPNLTSQAFAGLEKMVHIDLSNCSFKRIAPRAFANLWNLKILILSDNNVEFLEEDTFIGLSNLGTIHLNGNNIRGIASYAMRGLPSIKSLDLGHQMIEILEKSTFFGLRSLLTLDLSHNQLKYIENGAFSGLLKLVSLDLTGNRLITIGSKSFAGLHHLKYLTTDEFRFCCLARHIENCSPKPDEFSSCEDLLSNMLLRICIWILGIVSIIGNCVVIFCRTRNRLKNSVHSFLIANLALGDMLMGCYLVLIALVDYQYRGEYFIHDSTWRKSKLCQFAGFLSTLSSESSVFTLTIITMDRFLRIIFPLKFKRFKMTNARLTMVSTWLATALIAGIPLLDIAYFQNFYGRSGVCLSLHITRHRPNGWEYSVFVFLVLNFISFFFIAVAYVWMFIVAKRTRSALKSSDIRLSSTMAKRIMLIVMTDFWCWMPIIALGVLSLNGVELPPQVFAWVAVFILPLNAAMNPILYTLSTLTIFGRSSSRSGPDTKSSYTFKNNKKAIAMKHISIHANHSQNHQRSN